MQSPVCPRLYLVSDSHAAQTFQSATRFFQQTETGTQTDGPRDIHMSLTLSSGRIEDLDKPQGHLAFIRSQWRDFAAFAYEQFKTRGRGAVVLDLKGAEKLGENLRVPTRFIADDSESLRRLGGWPSDEIREIVQTYNPEEDVVFLILRLDGDIFHYNVSDDLTPADADRLNSEQRRKSS